MDYFFRSNVQIRNAIDLAHLLEFEKSVKSVTIRKGEIRRLMYEDDTTEKFVFTLRTRNPKEIRSLYKRFQEMLIAGDMTGYVAWHECRHEEKDEPCTWNEEMIHIETAGGAT